MIDTNSEYPHLMWQVTIPGRIQPIHYTLNSTTLEKHMDSLDINITIYLSSINTGFIASKLILTLLNDVSVNGTAEVECSFEQSYFNETNVKFLDEATLLVDTASMHFDISFGYHVN